MSNPHIGSSLDDWLREEGIYEETKEIAIRRVLAWKIEEAMKAQHITRREMAARMGTSRSQVDRLLNKNAPGDIKLETIQRGARALGKELTLDLV